jgi:hypothetical protein
MFFRFYKPGYICPRSLLNPGSVDVTYPDNNKKDLDDGDYHVPGAILRVLHLNSLGSQNYPMK